MRGDERGRRASQGKVGPTHTPGHYYIGFTNGFFFLSFEHLLLRPDSVAPVFSFLQVLRLVDGMEVGLLQRINVVRATTRCIVFL